MSRKKKGGEKAGGGREKRTDGEGRAKGEQVSTLGASVDGGGPSQPPPGVGVWIRGAPRPRPHPRPSPGSEKVTDQQSHSAELQKPSARVAKKH